MDLNELAHGLKALSDPTRIKIVALLKIRPLCVCELVPLFGISQPAISRHMHRLREAGLVTETRRGQWVFFGLNPERLEALRGALDQLPNVQNEIERLESAGLVVPCTPTEVVRR